MFTCLVFPVTTTGKVTEAKCIQTIQKVRKRSKDKRLIPFTQKCAQAFPKNSQIQYMRGLLLMEQSKYLSASRYFHKATRLEPKSPISYFYLLRCYLSVDDPMKKYRGVLESLKRHVYHQPRVLAEAGNILLDHGKMQTAYRYFKSLIEGDFKEKWIYYLKLGQMYLLVQKDKLALESLSLSFQKKPEEAMTMYFLAKVHQRSFNKAFAHDFYKRSIQKGLQAEYASDAKAQIAHLEATLPKSKDAGKQTK